MLSHSVLCARRGQGPPITSEMWEEMVIQGEIDRGSTEEAAAEKGVASAGVLCAMQ